MRRPSSLGLGRRASAAIFTRLARCCSFALRELTLSRVQNMREQCEALDVPAPLADVICMAMALDPAKRFASAEALGRVTRAAYDLSHPVRPPAPVCTPTSETVLTPQGLQNPQGFLGLPPPLHAVCSLAFRSLWGAFGIRSSASRCLCSLPEVTLPSFTPPEQTKATRRCFS